jgi:hypothetical protein
MISLMGYPAPEINYCPRCGTDNFQYQGAWNGNGVLECSECKCAVYLIGHEEDKIETEDEE